MPYLRSITQISDVSDDIIEELARILDKVIGLKNEAEPTPSATPPQPKLVKVQEGSREKEVTPEKGQPTPETAQPLEGTLAEMEARLMSYINRVKERVRVYYDAPLAEMNRKLDSLIALLQNWDVAAMNILQVLVENELEQVGETSAQVYVPAHADEDRLTYVTPDTEVHYGVFVDEQ